MHSYRGVRADYWEQATAEVKAPSRKLRGALIWQCRSGRRNEATDCEVYALHAAMARKFHTFSLAKWDSIEKSLSQNDLFAQPDDQVSELIQPSAKKPKRKRTASMRPKKDFMSKF